MSKASEVRRISDELKSSLVLVTEAHNGQALKLSDQVGQPA